MKCRFGKIEHNEMTLTEFGLIAQKEWGKLPERFPNFELDVFQIMPNHMHGIISVGAGFTPAHDRNNNNEQNGVGAGFTAAQNIPAQNNQGQPQGIAPTRAGVNLAATIGDIVGAYKSLVANECLKIYKSNNAIMGKFWQRNYYEHIIKNELSYETISEYIIKNPQQWEKDKFYNR